MQVFLVERSHAATYDLTKDDQAALHSRWAVDVYLELGAVWYGAVVAGDRTFGLVAAEDASVLDRYREKLGIPPGDMIVRPVSSFVGPSVAMSKNDPRFRPQHRP